MVLIANSSKACKSERADKRYGGTSLNTAQPFAESHVDLPLPY